MKSRKRSSSSRSANSPDRSIRNLLFASRNLRIGLSRVRRILPAESIPAFIAEYWKYPNIKAQIVRAPFPRKYSHEAEYVLDGVDLDREVIWNASCIRNFSEEVIEFIELDSRYTKSVLGGDFSEALEILDTVQEKFGLTTWGIIQRIFTLSQMEETSELERYTASVAEASANGVPGLIAWFYAQKMNPEVSRERFFSFADRYAEAIDDQNYPIFLRWIIDREKEFTASQIPSIITFGEYGSIVDRYILLKDCLCRLCSVNVELKRATTSQVLQLAFAVGDNELARIGSALAGNYETICECDDAELDVYDAYSIGDYESAIERCAKLLSEQSDRAHLYEIYARSLARQLGRASLDGGAPWSQIVRDILAVFLKGDDYEDALQRLVRTAYITPIPKLAWAIRSLLARELTPDDSSRSEVVDARAGICSSTGSPWHYNAIDKTLAGAGTLVRVGQMRPASPSIYLQRALAERKLGDLESAASWGIPPLRAAIYRGHCLRALGRHVDAIACYDEALTSDFTPDRLAASKGAAICMRAEGRYTEALDLIVTQCLQTPPAYRLFDLSGTIREVEAHGLPEAYASISLPIIYEIYSQNVANDLDPKRSDAAEEYVFSRQARLPSEIAPPEDASLLEKHIYFLKNVCTPRTIDPFIELENTSEVEIERISICQRLSEFDTVGMDDYINEIREITRRRVIRESLKQVEKSKIFVDVPSIHKAADKLLKDKYQRFQEAISRPDYDQSFMKMVNTIREIVGKEENVVQFPDHPVDEREQAFQKLCAELINLLLTSQEHGFKTYLSTRVKHGTLAAQLSSPFSLNNILLEASDDTYSKSQFWQKSLQLSDFQADRLHEVISSFSRDIEEIIQNLKDQYIQIKSDQFPSAWMDFSFFRNEILFLQAQIDESTTFDQFFDLVLNRFWRALDDNLSIVRRRLNEETKPTIALRLDSLQAAVEAALPGVWTAPLYSAIAAARTEVQTSLDVIIGWLKLSQAADRPDYDFSIAVEVAAESINSCFKNRQISVSRDIDVKRELKGGTLASMVDILFILFENAITHTHGGVTPSITIRAEGGENVLLLEVENSVPFQDNIEERNTALRERLSKVASETSQALVSTEGGSGFPKIVKILKHDLSGRSVVRARFVDAHTFRTDIEFESARVFA